MGDTDDGARANLGFEKTLWEAADKLRGHMDASEYKHIVLGLIFLKYISDKFEQKRSELRGKYSDPDYEFYIEDEDLREEALEDRDEYIADNVFWVPREARWEHLHKRCKSEQIGTLIDDAMRLIEEENDSLRNVLPKNYSRPSLDKRRLGELVDLIANVSFGEQGSLDLLGRVYEYFLGKFAAAEGKSGGEFYTPECVVQTLVEMIEPYHGRVFDPCCGSGGMFVQSEKFVEAHGGKRTDISIYGQESNPTTWRLCKMNLAIRGIDANLGGQHDDSFYNDLHKDLRADYVLANPPFNDSDWGGERLKEDVRWQFGTPPANNANYAWIQHFIHHLAPDGIAGFVMANGSMSTSTSAELEIRKGLVENDLVDCIVAMPGQLFYTTQIPVCLWFVTRDKKNGNFRDRRGHTLFIDAREMGEMRDRTHRTLTDEDISRIAGTYHAWRGESETDEYEDVPGFCAEADLEEIEGHRYILTPGRYVGAEEVEDDGEPFEEKMPKLVARLYEQFDEADMLEEQIRENLEGLGYGE
ncbi:MAG: type I restriction-modification system subunit M [Candidatus Brocadiia bacterium]